MINKISNYLNIIRRKFKYKKISYSLNAVDLIINYIFKDQIKGTYVDVGAQHPVSNNNTYLLYKRGWNGINIDLDKKNIDLFNTSRPKDFNLNYAISDVVGDTDLFFYHDASPINTLNEKVSLSQRAKVKEVKKIKTFPLNHILEKINSCLENIESDNFERFVEILNSIGCEFDLPIIVSTHPRTKNKIATNNFKFNSNIKFLKPLSFTSYVKLQLNSKFVLSDSGTINEESSILNFPALNLRESHERPEAMEETAVMMVGMNKERIFQALEILKIQAQSEKINRNIPIDYNVENISEKILKIIISYTDYIKKVIWRNF